MSCLVLIFGWTWLVTAEPATEQARVCVELLPSAAESVHSVDMHSLVAALRARIDRRRVRVQPCKKEETPDFRHLWRVTIEEEEASRLFVQVRGPETLFDERVDAGHLKPHEVAQMVALRAAEALRPAVDSMLKDLEEPNPSATDEFLEAMEAPVIEASPEVEVGAEPSVEHATMELPGVTLGGSGGPVMGFEKWTWAYQLELGADFPIWETSGLRLGTQIGAAFLPHRSVQGLRFSGETYQAGLGLLVRVEPFEVGAYGQARLTMARVSGGVSKSKGRWSGGAGLRAGVALAQWAAGELGIGGQMWGWAAPRTFWIRGEAALTQSYFEAFLGPYFRLRPSKEVF